MTNIENYGGKSRVCLDCGTEGHFTHMKGHECDIGKRIAIDIYDPVVTHSTIPARKRKSTNKKPEKKAIKRKK